MTDDDLDLPQINGEAKEAVKRIERDSRLARRFGFALSAMGTVVLFCTAIGTIYIGVGVRDLLRERVVNAERIAIEQKQAVDFTTAVLDCILGQFAEHRLASRYDIEQSARAHGYAPPTTPAPEPTFDHDKIARACARALAGG